MAIIRTAPGVVTLHTRTHTHTHLHTHLHTHTPARTHAPQVGRPCVAGLPGLFVNVDGAVLEAEANHRWGEGAQARRLGRQEAVDTQHLQFRQSGRAEAGGHHFHLVVASRDAQLTEILSIPTIACAAPKIGEKGRGGGDNNFVTAGKSLLFPQPPLCPRSPFANVLKSV